MPLAFALLLSLVLAPIPTQVSRRAPSGAKSATVPARIALRAGDQAYDFTGQAQCRHAREGSIYGVAAEMWSVQHNESGKGLTLTVWKPRDGSAPMLNLTVSTSGKESRVNTVKGSQQGQQAATSGSGTVTMAPQGKGGTFTIDATTAAGGKVTGTVTCEAFTPLVAEGGEE